MENKNKLELISEIIVKGDWCYAYELGEIFQCKVSNESEDHYISTEGVYYYTNNDPHHVYKIKNYKE